MGAIRVKLDEAREGGVRAPKFSPAGQSTQLIVGADASSDSVLLNTADDPVPLLWVEARVLFRVQPHSPCLVASARIVRRPCNASIALYQADWLLRHYEFSMQDLASSMPEGQLDLVVDPKTAWALANREHFPVDVNTAARHELLRVPGLGVRSVTRIVSSRPSPPAAFRRLESAGRPVLRRARFFIVTRRLQAAAGRAGQRTRENRFVAGGSAGSVVLSDEPRAAPQVARSAATFEAWRATARPLLAAGVEPAHIVWNGGFGAAQTLPADDAPALPDAGVGSAANATAPASVPEAAAPRSQHRRMPGLAGAPRPARSPGSRRRCCVCSSPLPASGTPVGGSSCTDWRGVPCTAIRGFWRTRRMPTCAARR